MIRWGLPHMRQGNTLFSATVTALLAIVLAVSGTIPMGVGRAAADVRGSMFDMPIAKELLAQPLQWQVLQAEPTPSGATLDTAVATTRADEIWSRTTGEDTVVALIDTGVAPIPSLSGAIAGEVDFTGTGGGDGYGHGTFMASLIAGRGPVAPGVAPSAGVLSLKVADAQGNTNVGAVLGALEWLAGPGRALGINVAVMALGVESDSPAGEIIDVATERLANLGVLVVTSSGNGGPGALMSPATSPVTLSVGSTDDGGTSDPVDDKAAEFSADGPDRVGVSQPDVIASGVRVVAPANPDSQLARDNPHAMVGDGLFRGSGTSMSTAIVAGVAALVADVRPDLRGDDIMTALAAGGHADATRAVSVADGLPRAPAEILDGKASTSFIAEAAALLERREEQVGQIENDRLTSRDRAEKRTGRRADARLQKELLRIDDQAERATQGAIDSTQRRLAARERVLLRHRVAAPSTRGWMAAEFADGGWSTTPWATSRWQSPEWVDTTTASVATSALDSIIADTHGVSFIGWDHSRWNAVHWGAVHWGAVHWGAVHWGAVHWGAVHWGAVHWGAVHWGANNWSAVHWGAVHWGANNWSAVHWGAVHWGAVHWGTGKWEAVHWGKTAWDGIRWGIR